MNILEASKKNNLEEVKRLLEEGIKVDTKDSERWTPLMYACRFGHVEIVKYLLAHKADFDIRSSAGVTPLMLASHFGYFEVVKVLLQYGANPNFTTHSDTTTLAFTLKGSNRKKRYNILLLLHQYSRLLNEDEKKLIQKEKYHCSFGSIAS